MDPLPDPQPTVPTAERDDVLRAKLGNREAFERLALTHHARLRAWVAGRLDRADDIAEVVQETFLGALRSLPQVDPERPFGAWLHGICRNQLNRFLLRRSDRRSRQQALVDQVLAEQVADDEADVSRIDALRRCLEQLGTEQRALLNARYHDGIAVQDLASRSGTSPNGISMRLLRLKEALARCIGQRGLPS
jgi:RNA polymerase sigma-70 factor (ECF subfamily)